MSLIMEIFLWIYHSSNHIFPKHWPNLHHKIRKGFKTLFLSSRRKNPCENLPRYTSSDLNVINIKDSAKYRFSTIAMTIKSTIKWNVNQDNFILRFNKIIYFHTLPEANRRICASDGLRRANLSAEWLKSSRSKYLSERYKKQKIRS